MSSHETSENKPDSSPVKPEALPIPEESRDIPVTAERLAEYSWTVGAQVENVIKTTDGELAQSESVFHLDAETVAAVQEQTGVKGKLQSNWDALVNLKRDTQAKLVQVVTSEGFSNAVDYAPVVGSAKMVGEAAAGKRLSGEKISGMDRIKHGAKGAAFLAADLTGVGEVARLGKAGIAAAKIGEAAAVKALGKQALKESGKLHARGKERVDRGKRLSGRKPEQVIDEPLDYNAKLEEKLFGGGGKETRTEHEFTPEEFVALFGSKKFLTALSRAAEFTEEGGYESGFTVHVGEDKGDILIPEVVGGTTDSVVLEGAGKEVLARFADRDKLVEKRDNLENEGALFDFHFHPDSDETITPLGTDLEGYQGESGPGLAGVGRVDSQGNISILLLKKRFDVLPEELEAYEDGVAPGASQKQVSEELHGVGFTSEEVRFIKRKGKYELTEDSQRTLKNIGNVKTHLTWAGIDTYE